MAARRLQTVFFLPHTSVRAKGTVWLYSTTAIYSCSYTLQLPKSAAPFTWIYMYHSFLDPDPGHSIFSCTARMVEQSHLDLSATPPYVGP